MGQLVAEQGREVMLPGVRAAAGMNGRIADAGYGRSHHLRTLEHVAEVQRDLYLDALNHALESGTTLLQLAAQMTQQPLRPLQARAGNGTARV